MTTRLKQKHLLKGTQEFEIVDDMVEVRIKMPFKEEQSLTVMLTVLYPEPVINKSRLEFVSRVNREPLISLFLANPNAEEFNAFVNTLKQRAEAEFNAFAGLKSASHADMLAGNVHEEPPEFDEASGAPDTAKIKQQVDVMRLDEAINMLNEHLDPQDISGLLAALQALKQHPENESLITQLVDEFNALGPFQGAVLTYAPYLSILLADDPFNWG